MLIMNAKSTHTDEKTTTLYFPKELHSQLKIEAIKRETSMTQLVIEAVRKELETTKTK